MSPQRNVAIIRSLATTAEGNVESDGTGPTNKQQQRAHRHGEIPRAADLDARGRGGKVHAKRTWGHGDAQKTRTGPVCPGIWALCNKERYGATPRPANGRVSICKWNPVCSCGLSFKRKKKGEKPGGDLNALIFTLGRAEFCSSRGCREGKANPWMRGLRARRLKCQHR